MNYEPMTPELWKEAMEHPERFWIPEIRYLNIISVAGYNSIYAVTVESSIKGGITHTFGSNGIMNTEAGDWHFTKRPEYIEQPFDPSAKFREGYEELRKEIEATDPEEWRKKPEAVQAYVRFLCTIMTIDGEYANRDRYSEARAMTDELHAMGLL